MLWIESPIGARRHLWGHYHGLYGVRSAMDRRGPNSSIQGTASHIGTSACYEILYQKFKWFTSKGRDLLGGLDNYVHDSLKSTVYIPHIPIWCYLKEHAMTTLMHQHYKDNYGLSFNIGLEAEFGIGGNGSDVTIWNYTPDYNSTDAEGKITAQGLIPLIESKMETVIDKDPRLENKKYKKRLMDKVLLNTDVLSKLRLKELKEDKEKAAATSFLLSDAVIDKLDLTVVE